jgi:hypothetical protein
MPGLDGGGPFYPSDASHCKRQLGQADVLEPASGAATAQDLTARRSDGRAACIGREQLAKAKVSGDQLAVSVGDRDA